MLFAFAILFIRRLHLGRFETAELSQLGSLNVSGSRVTSAGLQHLTKLKNLKSLTLESTKVTANDIKKLHESYLPDLVAYRPE